MHSSRLDAAVGTVSSSGSGSVVGRIHCKFVVSWHRQVCHGSEVTYSNVHTLRCIYCSGKICSTFLTNRLAPTSMTYDELERIFLMSCMLYQYPLIHLFNDFDAM